MDSKIFDGLILIFNLILLTVAVCMIENKNRTKHFSEASQVIQLYLIPNSKFEI